MKRCPVCLERLFSKPGKKEFYECAKCGNKIPKSVAMESTATDPAIILYNDNYSNAMAAKLLMAASAAAAVYFITPAVKGPDFLIFYVLGAIVAFPASSLIGQAIGAPGEGSAIALWAIESAGAARITTGLYHGMAKFDVLIFLMGIAYLFHIMITNRGNLGSPGGGGGCGSSCSTFTSSCGGGCGGGCGGCGGCGGS